MKYTPTALIGPLSGSQGSTTASHNRYGYYFRFKSSPVNPNSTRQATIRGIFAQLVNRWTSTVTAAQRIAWETYAANTPVLSKGVLINLTAQTMYIRCNAARRAGGFSIVDDAPTVFNTGEAVSRIRLVTDGAPDVFGLNLAGTDLAVRCDLTGAASDDGDLLLYLGQAQNLTRNFFKGPYQFAGSTAISATDTQVDLTNALAILQNGNGAPTLGQLIPSRLVAVYDDGRVATSYETLAIVTADSA